MNNHAGSRGVSAAANFGTNHTVSLEGDFNKYFKLYVAPGQEVPALAVFAPDLMSLMEDESKHFSVELAGNRVYIYRSGFISTSDQLQAVYALAKQLSIKLRGIAGRMADDADVFQTPANSPLTGTEGLSSDMSWRKLGKVMALWFGAMVVLGIILFIMFAIAGAHQNSGQNPVPSPVQVNTYR
jgi:hypothetical protein